MVARAWSLVCSFSQDPAALSNFCFNSLFSLMSRLGSYTDSTVKKGLKCLKQCLFFFAKKVLK